MFRVDDKERGWELESRKKQIVISHGELANRQQNEQAI